MKLISPLQLLPRLQDIFFIAIFGAVLSLGQRMLNLDGDLPRHLLMGKYILQYKTIPTTELFIHPYLNQAYVPHEWLSNLLFYILYSSWGPAGLVLIAALLLAAAFSILYSRLSTQLDLRIPVLILVTWGAMATSLNWAVRPHLVSMYLLVIWLAWADDLYSGKKVQIWPFPLLMLAWSNLHGEFIAGILVLLAYSVGWVMDFLFGHPNANLSIGKNIWLAFLLSVAASLINPSGLGPWLSLSGFVGNEYLMSRMVEANAPNLQIPEMRVLLLLLAFSILLLAIKKERFSAGQGLLLAGFSAMSLIAIRNIHLYGMVAPFVLAQALCEAKNFRLIDRIESTLRNIEGKTRGVAWILIATVILGANILRSDAGRSYQFAASIFPVQAVEWLENHPQQGNMFNNLNWGGYLEFHLWPEQLAFIDSMADTSGQVTRQYETVITLQPNWQGIFKEHNITWVIIPPDWPLAKELAAQGWESAYQDETAIILVKE